MFCCLDWSGSSTSSSYPGRRSVGDSYSRTAGNAVPHPNYNKYQQQASTVRDYEPFDVKVPIGSKGGDQITAVNPNGVLVSVNIPHGLTAGDTFMVEVSTKENSIPVYNNNYYQSKSEIKPVPFPSAPPISEIDLQSYEPPKSLPGTTSLENYYDSIPSTTDQNNHGTLILVHAPIGVEAGSIIHVQVPGHNNTIIEAQVPPGVSEFYVSYNPTNIIAKRRNHYETFTRKVKSKSSNENYEQGRFYNNFDANHRRNYDIHNNRNDCGISSVNALVPILAGAALMGGAGYMVSQHQKQLDKD